MRFVKGGIFLKIFISFWISLIAFSCFSIVLYIMSDKEFLRMLSIKTQHSTELRRNLYINEKFKRLDNDDFIKLVKKISTNSYNKSYLFDHNLIEITDQELPDELRITLNTLVKQNLRVVRQISDSKIINAFVLRNPDGSVSDITPYVLTVYSRPVFTGILNELLRNYYREILIHIFVISIISYFLARHFTVPIREVNEASEKIASGAFDISLSHVTERNDEFGELALNFIEMAERLEENRQQQIRMFRDISHELRSPLTRMRLAIELALSKSDQPTAKLLNRIEIEWDRMGAMINDLKAVSDSTKKQIQFEEFDFSVLIDNLMPDFHFEAEASGKKIVFNGREKCIILGNKRLLSSAVENVVRNSLMYASKKIEMTLTKRELFVFLEVTDDGFGVMEENLERIFIPFFRENTDRDRKTGGTGLGLAIAKRAVDVHHGQIYALNTDKGFSVTIKLPMANS